MKNSFTFFMVAATALWFNIAKSQDITSFSGSNKGDNLNFSFYNPLIQGTQKFKNNIVSSGPYQMLKDTAAILDTTIAKYDLDSIPEQMVFYNTPCRFYLKSNALTAAKKIVIGNKYYITSGKPLANLQINRFNEVSYITNIDTLDFYVQFALYSATGDTVKSKNSVHFKIVPTLPYEVSTFGVGGQAQLPSLNDREFNVQTIDSNISPTLEFNFVPSQNLKTVSYSGVQVVLENNPNSINQLYLLDKKKDVNVLNLYAETLIIKGGFTFPQTTVNIYAKELIFDDSNGPAYICTTPLQGTPNPGANGIQGLTAGNIYLHILKFTANPGIRFILNGGDGESSPDDKHLIGPGGNGGSIFSTVDVTSYTIAEGGYSGNKTFDPRIPYKGSKGKYFTLNNKADWLHPNFLHIVINYCKEGFYAGLTDPIIQKLQAYYSLINGYAADSSIYQIDSDNLLQIKQLVQEINEVFYKINNHLDYYGNPPGWVPMLSFEVTKAAYTVEVSHALNVLYLDQLVQNANNTLAQRQAIFKNLSVQAEGLVQDNAAQYHDIAFVEIPGIQQQIQNNQGKILSLQQQLSSLNDEINKRAQQIYTARHTPPSGGSFLGKMLGAVSDVMEMIPTPYTQIAGAALNEGVQLLGSNDLKNSFKQGGSLVNKVTGALQPITSGLVSNQISVLSNNISTGTNDILGKISTIGNINDALSLGNEAVNLYNTNKATADSIAQSVGSVVNLFNNVTHVNSDELGSIKGELIANEPRFGVINEDIESVQNNQVKLGQQLQTSTQQMLAAKIAVDNGLTAISHYSDGEFDAASAYNHTLSVLSNDMRRKAFDRLRKYHYYMAKAYEYRTMQPYTGSLDNSNIIFSIDSLITKSSGSPVLSAAQVNALVAVYNEEISQIAENIYSYYNANRPAQTISSTFRLSGDEIKALNQGMPVKINLVERGVFRPSEEDVRIDGIAVTKIVNEPPGTLGLSDNVDFTFNYPNYSKIKKAGKVYSFNNYNLNTQYPIFWQTRYDLYSQQIANSHTSASANSLLASLLTNDPAASSDLYLYSRPSAWADISLVMDRSSDGVSKSIKMDSLFIQVQYDYLPKPANIVNVEIKAANKWFAPTFQLNTPDNYSKQNGIGDLHRAYYIAPTTVVSAAAPRVYGRYMFKRWTDQNGNTLAAGNGVDTSGGNVIRYTLATDRLFQALYQFAGPVLSIPDTVYVDNTLKYSLHIKNTGTGPLYWELDTVTNWIRYPAQNGINDSTLSLTFENNPDSLNSRRGRMDVFSMETELMDHNVYFVQPKGNGLYIKSFTPANAATGTTATIIGKSFIGATAVSFGGTPATSFKVLDDTTIIAVVGQGSSGLVTVTAPKGIAQKGGFTYIGNSPLPAITITANQKDTICSGSSITLTASVKNAGGSLSYQWKKNNTAVGTNVATYQDSLLKTGDSVICILTVSGHAYTSNVIKLTVNALVSPMVTISANIASPICTKTKVVFTATAAGGGTTPVYKWYKDNLVVGVNSDTYADSLLKSGDSIWCVVTSNAKCLVSNTSTSPKLKYAVNALAPATPSGISGSSSVKAGQSCSYKVTKVAGVNYLWSVPVGDTIKNGQGTDSVTVKWSSVAGTVTVRASNGCGMSAVVGYAVSITAGIGNPKRSTDKTETKILLYPNPVTDAANIQLFGFTGGVIVTITDMAGKVVWQHDKLTNSSFTLPLSSFASGIYILTVKDLKNTKSLKLIKAK